MGEYRYIKWFNEIGKDHISTVGGKAASLGELARNGFNVAPGFCVTTDSYMEFIHENELDEFIKILMYGLNEEDFYTLENISNQIKKKIIDTEISSKLREEIVDAYKEFSKQLNTREAEVAIRSSATEEDLPEASFAGQQDTYLYIRGEVELLRHIKMCWASLWNSRAIYYRIKQDLEYSYMAMSVVVQSMIDSGNSGVLLTANPINGNTDEMIINSSWGLGESVTLGIVTPDEYIIDKNTRKILNKSVSDKNIMTIRNKDGIGTLNVKVEDFLGEKRVKEESLSEHQINILISYGIKIEEIYGIHQDIEWAMDANTNEIHILQSRPITSMRKRQDGEDIVKELKVLIKGVPASPGFGMGRVRNIVDISEINLVEEGDIIVATMTNPDMIPAMRRAAAVVTDDGGTTCHAAIVSRELQIPCIVGATDASTQLKDGMEISVDATMGIVYKGYL